MQNTKDSLLQGGEFQACFMRLVEASIAPSTGYDDFRDFIRTHVRPVLPHEMLLVVIGRAIFDQVVLDHVITVDYPDIYACQIGRNTTLAERPVIARWLATQKPILIDQRHDQHLLSALELREVEEFGLGDLAIHGQIDMSGRMASYFSFAQVKNISEEYRLILETITPHLNAALMKAHAAERASSAGQLLTPKELEILRWVVVGHTNREIASILSKSEMTVRNQVHCVLKKLGVSNRSEAARRADDLGLLVRWANVAVQQSAAHAKQLHRWNDADHV
jgi:transcriptional regulator EpsA